MPTPLIPQSIRNIGVRGLIREAEVDNSLIPEGAVTEAVNVHFDRRGAVTVRTGVDVLGATIATGYPIVGLHNVQLSTLIAVIDQAGSSSVYSFSGSAWGQSLGSGSAAIKARFVDFASMTILCNFGVATNGYSSIRFWTGVADGGSYWKSTGTPINPHNLWPPTAGVPQGGVYPQFIEVYKSRVYLAGNSYGQGDKDRLWFSSVIDTQGSITWSPRVSYVDINPSDGENISGLKRYSLELLIFKPNYIYKFRTAGVDPDPLITVGTQSQESIVEGKRALYFYHDTGVYSYQGGYPKLISPPIQDIIDAVPYSQLNDITGWKDKRNVYWSLGNLVIAGETWRNVVIRYTESSELWTTYSYANDVERAVLFDNQSTIRVAIGTSNGIVGIVGNAFRDFGEPIKYRVITKWYEWEGIWNQKVIQKLIAICEKSQGGMLMYQVDDSTAWKDLGQLRKYLNFFNNLSVKFHRIRFKITGVSSIEPAIFQGLEIIEGLNEGIVENV